MSALLQIVSELRDVREAAEEEFRKAIRQAADALDARGRRLHTGTEIAQAAGLTKQRISQILAKGEGSDDTE